MTAVRDRSSNGGTATPPPDSFLRRHWRVITFVVVAVLYALLTVSILVRSDVGRFDRYVYTIHFKRDHLELWQFRFFYQYVKLGQRGIATVVFLPYFVWTAWRLRSARPLVMLIVALLLLNVSVGAVKLSTGRIGPDDTYNFYALHMGGDIFPSGHVSNAVVLYGLMAMISLRHTKLFAWLAVWISFSVGISTIMINTHWFSDIVGGWMAGGLVLLALPWFVPTAERLVDRVYRNRVKAHTDPVVAKLTRRWPRLAFAGAEPDMRLSRTE